MKITQKLILIFLLISVIPLIVISVFELNRSEETIKNETVHYLSLISEMVHEKADIFLEHEKIRAIDWVSDKYISTESEKILIDKNSLSAKELGAYIKENKQSFDKYVIITDIVDLAGKIVASTLDGRIGYSEDKNFLDIFVVNVAESLPRRSEKRVPWIQQNTSYSVNQKPGSEYPQITDKDFPKNLFGLRLG